MQDAMRSLPGTKCSLDYAEEMAVDVCIWVYQIKDEEQKCSKPGIYILMAEKDENKPI
jgi:hypothetical protein